MIIRLIGGMVLLSAGGLYFAGAVIGNAILHGGQSQAASTPFPGEEACRDLTRQLVADEYVGGHLGSRFAVRTSADSLNAVLAVSRVKINLQRKGCPTDSDAISTAVSSPTPTPSEQAPAVSPEVTQYEQRQQMEDATRPSVQLPNN